MFQLIKGIVFRLVGEKFYQKLFIQKKLADINNPSYVYEKEMLMLPFLVKPGDEVIDVGANYGHFTVALSKLTGNNGKVYAFEPIPYTNQVLREVVKKACEYSNVLISDNGISDQNQTLEFTVPRLSFGAANTGLSHLKRPGEQDNNENIKIQCKRLDDLFEHHANKISFVKMDIEGAEYFALCGAKNFLLKHRPALLIEVSLGFMEKYNISSDQLLSLIDELNYEVFQLLEEKNQLRKITQLQNSNVFLLPKEKMEYQQLVVS